MLKVYPRGYVGPILDNIDEEKYEAFTEILVVRNTYKIDTKIKDDVIVADKDIMYLFNKYHEDQYCITYFDFREQILQKAKEFFTLGGKTKSFKTFIKAQLNSSKVTYNHVEVLKEILDFVFHGKTGFRLVTWERILTNDEKPSYLSEKSKAELGTIFDNDKFYCQKSLNSVNKVIQKWVSQPDGYSHLLRTLWLFFGDYNDNQEDL